MEVYKIKKKSKAKKIVRIIGEDEGYEFKPNMRNNQLIKISNLYIYNDDLINQILVKKNEKIFRRLTAIALSVLNDEDATSGDAIIALDEIAKQKSIIIRKYLKYLTQEEEQKMLKRLKMLEKKLKERLEYLIKEEEKNYSR